MTQLPFPGQPPAPPSPAAYAPAYAAQQQQTYCAAPPVHEGYAPVGQVGGPSPGGGGAPLVGGSLGREGGAHAAPAYAAYPAGGAAPSLTYSTPGNTAYSPSPAPPVPSHAASPTPSGSRPPVPPPRRAATLPAAPMVPALSPTVAMPAPADPAVAAFHRSLVAYYWHYAQQGFAAPLTAAEGTVERVQQERARTEAVDWARTCGIAVVDPAAPTPISSAGVGAQRAAIQAGDTGARAMSRPLPSAPAGAVSSPPVPPSAGSAGRPLPTAAPHSASAPPVISTTAPSSTRSPLPPTPSSSTPTLSSQLGRSASLVNPPSPTTDTFPRSVGAPLARSASDASPRGAPAMPALPQKRPLPAPPVAQLAHGLDGISISPSPVSTGGAAPPAVPSIALPNEATAEPAKPPIPSFSFGDEDDDPPSSAPAVPTFSFGGTDDADDGVAPPSTPSRRSAPLHPRHDPSHPSHKLYHPTSVLPSSPSAPAAPAALPEAGTLTCTACRALIFGRVLVALGREWHPDCFCCAEDGCGARLEVMEFDGTPEDWDQGGGGDAEEAEALRGKAWCMVHFEERFALECHQCRTPIASADYLPIADALLPPREGYRSTTTRYYHPLHFFCSGCGDPFVDPVSYELLPGEGALEARPYVPREGHPYCDACDLRMWRPKCVGCRKGLREEDGFLEVEGGKWHEGCFVCSMCTKPLSGIYLLRRSLFSSSALASHAAGADEDTEDVDEHPYCAECYDIKAKEEAEQAVGVARRG